MKICADKNFKQLASAIERIERYLGTTVNPEENTITSDLNIIKDKLTELSESVVTYQSDSPKLEHIIDHNLESFFLDINILSEEEDGWENILCSTKYINNNRIQINLCEEKNIIVTIYKLK